MANLPAYILKDTTLVAADGNRIGQAMEITIPVMEKTTEEFRNAGMIKPREVTMGHEVTTCTLKETAFDPDMLHLYGLAPGDTHPIIALGYLESEDGREHEARFEMEAEVKKIDAGAWSPASKAETEFEVTVHSGALFIDDQEILAFDDFSYRVNGQVQHPGRADALRMR